MIVQFKDGKTLPVTDEKAQKIQNAIETKAEHLNIDGELYAVNFIAAVRNETHEERAESDSKARLLQNSTQSHGEPENASGNAIRAHRVRKSVGAREYHTYYAKHPSYKLVYGGTDTYDVEFSWVGKLKDLPDDLRTTEVVPISELEEDSNNQVNLELPESVKSTFFST